MATTIAVASVVSLNASNSLADAEAAPRPNVLLIMADDLGFSDLGCYGGEIETPNLDQLGENGLRYTQFYNTARCWPTRAALLTGYYAQQIRRDTVPGVPSGGRGVRPAWAPLLSQQLRGAGYRSYHSGKWHIDGMPLENGFDRSYYIRDQGRFFNPQVHWEDDIKLPPIPAGTDYYATTRIADHAIQCLSEHTTHHPDQPFFHYLAFTAPHFPLQALPEDIAKYRDKYRTGWDDVRRARYARQRATGLLDSALSAVEFDVGPPYGFPDAIAMLGPGETNRPLPWDTMTDVQRSFQAGKMAIHAAMIDRMDQAIGRVVVQLKAMNAFDNTLVLFLSDNGASAEIMVRDSGHDPNAAPGSAKSYLCLGPGWSTVCNTPFRRHKTWVHEGGISTPLIAHWPRGITARGTLRHMPGHVIDIVPTILELAGATTTDQPSAVDEAIPVCPGQSLVSTFTSDAEFSRPHLWWAHEGNRAIRIDNWKLVAAGNDAPWELFNLQQDRSETNNLAHQQPEKVRELASAWTSHWDEFRKLAAMP